MPTLTSSFVYSGRIDTNALGTTTTNGVSLFAQAIPYRGIGILGNATYGLTNLPTGQDSQFDSLTFSATAQPNDKLTLAGTFGHSERHHRRRSARSSSASNRVEGTISFTPVRALYLSAGASRTVTQPRPVTLANGTVSFSPFQGGDLQFSMTYTQSLEADTSVNRIISPSIRWNLRRATASPPATRCSTPRGRCRRQPTFDADLRIPL